jgi:hypothetical protein
MDYRLGPDVHFCVLDGRAIFLDVQADRYNGLSRDTNDAFLRLAQGFAASPGDSLLLSSLVDRGLLISGHIGPRVRMPTLSAPRQEIPIGLEIKLRLFDSIHASQVQLAARRLRRHGLAFVLQSLSRRRRQIAKCDRLSRNSEFARIRAAFRRTQPLFTSTEQCLARSVAFVSMCYDRGLLPALVVGVRDKPFSAHCWVQSDDIVLNDDMDRVRLFKPILSL